MNSAVFWLIILWLLMTHLKRNCTDKKEAFKASFFAHAIFPFFREVDNSHMNIFKFATQKNRMHKIAMLNNLG